MQLSDGYIKEFQAIYKKEYGKELSWEEASDGVYRLAGLAEICIDMYLKRQENHNE